MLVEGAKGEDWEKMGAREDMKECLLVWLQTRDG